MRGSHGSTTTENMHKLVEDYRRQAPTRPLVVFVDYLQKVPIIPEPTTVALLGLGIGALAVAGARRV